MSDIYFYLKVFLLTGILPEALSLGRIPLIPIHIPMSRAIPMKYSNGLLLACNHMLILPIHKPNSAFSLTPCTHKCELRMRHQYKNSGWHRSLGHLWCSLFVLSGSAHAWSQMYDFFPYDCCWGSDRTYDEKFWLHGHLVPHGHMLCF